MAAFATRTKQQPPSTERDSQGNGELASAPSADLGMGYILLEV